MGLPSLHSNQNVKKIMKLMSHQRLDTQMGKRMVIFLNWHQISTGYESPSLEERKGAKHVVCQWMGNLLKFLRTTYTYIRAPGLWTPNPLRENYSAIMENRSQTNSASLLNDVNVVGMYLRATMISEITTSSGKLIALAALTGKNTYEQHHANLEWPHQPCPSKRAWSRWRKVTNRIAPKRKLMIPLGRWLPEVEKRWSFFQSPGNHDRLLQRTKKGWKVYKTQFGAMWAF